MLLFKFCAVCDAPFVPVRRDARFCGNACRQREYRRRDVGRRRLFPSITPAPAVSRVENLIGGVAASRK